MANKLSTVSTLARCAHARRLAVERRSRGFSSESTEKVAIKQSDVEVQYRLSSYTKHIVQVARKYRMAARALGVHVSGPVPLPTKTKRWSILRSPFKHHKAQEAWERKTHRQLLVVRGDSGAIRAFEDFVVTTLPDHTTVHCQTTLVRPLSELYTHRADPTSIEVQK